MEFNVVFAPRDSALTYFLPFSRAWELIFGALLAFVAARYRTILNQNNEPSLTQNAVGALGLGAILAAVFCIDQFKPYPGWWALLPTVGAVMVIAAGPSSWANRKLLSSRPAVSVGLISYPLYLWH